VDQLAAAQKLNGGNANALRSELDGAKKQLERGNTGAAGDKLDEVLSILDSLVSSGKLSAADAKPLHDLVERVLRSITV
jgi:hypothetical protein